MKKKTGRNDPCPCGSGKKYKKCCSGEGAIMPILPQEMFDEDARNKYQEMMDNWDSGLGQPPTFMEYMGKPNPATGSIHNISKLVEGRDFQSEEELRSFVNEHTEAKNSEPLDDFIGLSPRQMNYILNRGFDGNSKSFLDLYFNLEEEVFEFYGTLKMKDNPMWINVTQLMQSSIDKNINTVLKVLNNGRLTSKINQENFYVDVKDKLGNNQ